MRRVGLLLSGSRCASGWPGARESAGAPTAVADPESATTVERAPSPRDVAVADLDPCSLLTAEQRADLQLDGEPDLNEGRSVLYRGPEPTCIVSGFEPRAVAVGVSLPYDGLGIAEGFPALQAMQSSPMWGT